MKNKYFILTSLLAFGLISSAHAAVSARVNKNDFTSGERIQLQLQHNGRTDSQPDISPLRDNFQILGSSSGSNIQIINGHISSETQVTVFLLPKRDGALLIPPLQWDGQQTAPITISVNGGSGVNPQTGQAADTNDHVFMTATLEQKKPYVQSTEVLTVRIYADQALSQATMDFPASSDVLVKQLGNDVQSSETRNGRDYQVFERKYLLTPQRSGKITLNSPTLDAQIADGSGDDFFGNNAMFGNIFKQMQIPNMVTSTRPIRIHVKPIVLDVLQRPTAAKGENWLPAQKVTLEETWHPTTMTIHVGEPLTRHLHLSALGLVGNQLPDLNTLMSLPQDIKSYPDKASVTDKGQGDTVLGNRDQDIALMATQPGHYQLPAVVLHWWDTINNSDREVTLPARTINVLPATSTANNTVLPPTAATQTNMPVQSSPVMQQVAVVPSDKSGGDPVWRWISLVLALLWLGTAAAWWRVRRQIPRTANKSTPESPQQTLGTGASLKALKRACQDNDVHAARQHLLAWAGTVWPEAPPLGLNELAGRMTDDTLAQSIRQLDRACYTGSNWQGETLAQTLSHFTAPTPSLKTKPTLPALYAK